MTSSGRRVREEEPPLTAEREEPPVRLRRLRMALRFLRYLLYDALLFEVLSGDILGILLVQVYLPVQLAHGRHVEAGRDFVQDPFNLRVLLEHVAPDDRRRVVEGPDALRVLHHHELIGGQLTVGGEAHPDVAFAALQPRVAEAEFVYYLDLLEVEGRVVLFDVWRTFLAVLELGERDKREVLGGLGQLAHVREAFLLGDGLTDEDAIGVVKGCWCQHRVGRTALGVELSGGVVGRFSRVQVGRIPLVGNYFHERSASVLGVEGDLAVLRRLDGNPCRAQIELRYPVEPVGVERLGIHAAQYELLGKVFRADGDRRAAPAAGARAVSTAHVAAGNDEQQREAR